MKGKGFRQKAQQKLTSRSVYPFPLLFRRLSTVFFIDSETNETIPLHSRNVFHFFSEKNSLSKTFLVECVRSGAESCITWDQALFSFRFENYIPAGKAKRKESLGAYHLTEKSGWGGESIMVSNLPVYRRNATSVTVWIQKRANLCRVSLEPRRNWEIG